MNTRSGGRAAAPPVKVHGARGKDRLTLVMVCIVVEWTRTHVNLWFGSAGAGGAAPYDNHTRARNRQASGCWNVRQASCSSLLDVR